MKPDNSWPGPPVLTNDEWLAWCDDYRRRVVEPERFLALAHDPARVPVGVPFRWLESSPSPSESCPGDHVVSMLADWVKTLHAQAATRTEAQPFSL